MASAVEICNRALQKLGAKRITSLTQDSSNARACNVAYESVLKSELRAHTWNFAIKRAEIAADATSPTWGKAKSFQLPSDFLFLAHDYPEDNLNSKDWQIEGRKILTDDAAPIYIRYIYLVTDPNEMDSLFIEAFATQLALQLCEEITQSNSKKDAIFTEYKDIIKTARKANAIEQISAEPPEDTWITVRA